MSERVTIKRTNSDDPDFRQLVLHLDNELWNELNEDQTTYDQYNKVPGLNTVLVVYENEKPVAIGCFKKYNDGTVEIKRMFVEKEYRGKGLSKIVLSELEKWAEESGFQYSILETSVHFKVAQRLYTEAGYGIIDNYDQYKGLSESVCMKKYLNPQSPSDPARAGLKGSNEAVTTKHTMIFLPGEINGFEYFEFEKDFVEKNIRCIPMIVRFKMDKAGIKLKLTEWSKFNIGERTELAKRSIKDEGEIKQYKEYLIGLVKKHTGREATGLSIDLDPAWAKLNEIPVLLLDKLKEFDWSITLQQWRELTSLQRFALIKLSREGHESKNFPKAIREFGLVMN